MPRDFLEQMADIPVPPVPASFNRALHERLNRRLLVAHLLDLGLRGMGYAFLHFARATMGLVVLTLSGKFDTHPGDR